MLYDFLLLETYYGTSCAALFFEDIARKYGPGPVRNALSAGDLVTRQILMGPDSGRWLIWLSGNGRAKAEKAA